MSTELAASHLVYRKPSWYTTSWKDKAADVTDEHLAKWEAETRECEEHNAAVYRQISEKRKQLLAIAEEVYGKNSTELKYLNNHGQGLRPSFYFESGCKEVVIKAREKRAQEEKQREAGKQLRALTERAILWLQGKGRVLGKDFCLDGALDVANQIAADEEIARLIAMGGPHSFSGEDSCEDCSGWDGTSKRCGCGNRRVDWVVGDGHTFEKPCVYAEAY